MTSEKLYILPFDHRASLARLLGGTEKIKDAKQVIYGGLLRALERGVRKEDAAILVDEEFGAEILKDAAERGIRRIVPTEKSGQQEFDFQYGEAFQEHIEAFKPEFVKALVRYNPANDAGMNRRQAERLKTLSDYCARPHTKGFGVGASRGYAFLCELLATPTEEQMKSVNGDKQMYDRLLRGTVMVKSIEELRSRGVNPAIWKVEGLEDPDAFGRAVEKIKKDSAARIVILGRDENRATVEQWISVAASFPEVVGFAVGRTIFEEPIVAWHQGTMSAERASEEIATRFMEFVSLFEKNVATR